MDDDRDTLTPSSSALDKALNGLPERLLSSREVGALLSCSRATVDRYEAADPRFPRRVHLSPRKCAWRLTELMKWLDSKRDEAAA